MRDFIEGMGMGTRYTAYFLTCLACIKYLVN